VNQKCLSCLNPKGLEQFLVDKRLHCPVLKGLEFKRRLARLKAFYMNGYHLMLQFLAIDNMDDGVVMKGYAVLWVYRVTAVVQVQVADRDAIAAGRLLVEMLPRDDAREAHYLGYFLIVAEIDLDVLGLRNLVCLEHGYDNV
jgi:hypothetical protein